MKKVLFTIQWYGIPSKIAASANALCDENIINEMKRSNEYEIHVLSYGVSGYPIEEFVNGVFVHRFKRNIFFDYYVRNRTSKSVMYKLLRLASRFILRIKQILFFPIFPNYEPLHTYNFEIAARSLHKKFNFDIVFSEFNGIDSLYAGLAVRKTNQNVIFIPLCWDSISGGRLANFMPKALCLKLRRRAEVNVMKYADAAIVMRSSKSFHDKYTSKYSYYSKLIFLDVPYFIIRGGESLNNPVGNTVKMLFAGTMADRTPKPLFDVLSCLNYRFDFLFVCTSEFHTKLMNYNNLYRNISIKCLPYMSHEELVEYQKRSDILVNFGVSNFNAVSGKIFDYMSTGKPIVSTAKADGDACIPYLNRYPLAFVLKEYNELDYNVGQFENFLKKIRQCKVDIAEIQDQFVENSPKTYIKTFEEIVYNRKQ